MQFNSIYENLDTRLTAHLNENNVLEVPFVNQDPPQLISPNEFFLRPNKLFKFYTISANPLSILKNILSLSDSTLDRFETFLNNIGPVFINDFSVDAFNERQNLVKVFVGENASKNNFFAIGFEKHDFHLHVTEEGMKFSAHYSDLTTARRHPSGDANIDFELALDDFIVYLTQLTGMPVDSEFSAHLSFLKTEQRINKLLIHKNVVDISYVNKIAIEHSIANYKPRDTIEVNEATIYFSKEDAKGLLIALRKLFTNQSYDVLVNIVTAVTNYQKSIGSVDKFKIHFPVKDIFYDISKLPFIVLYLNEKYQIGFSVNGFSFTNNAIVHHVPDYKRLPSVLSTILEERSRVVDMDRLTAPLT